MVCSKIRLSPRGKEWIFVDKKVNKLLIAFCIVGVSMMLIIDFAYACTPFPPTPWFSEKLSLIETNLPLTITSSEGRLRFVSTTGDPFYFLYNRETKSLGTEISLRIEFYDDFDVVLVNEYGFSDFEHLNKIGDNRPDDTLPPRPQDIAIPISLDGNQYAINLRIIYEINQAYIPDSVEQWKNACRGYPFLPLPQVVSMAIIGGIIFLVLVVVIAIRRSKLSN